MGGVWTGVDWIGPSLIVMVKIWDIAYMYIECKCDMEERKMYIYEEGRDMYRDIVSEARERERWCGLWREDLGWKPNVYTTGHIAIYIYTFLNQENLQIQFKLIKSWSDALFEGCVFKYWYSVHTYFMKRFSFFLMTQLTLIRNVTCNWI